jgi:membrane protease YdiL (CAAX protease family)
MTGTVLLVAVLVLSAGGWAFLFRLPSKGLWPRTWITALVLGGAAAGALALRHDLGVVTGPLGIEPLAAGLVVGSAWLVATHIGHFVLCRFVPGFLERISDLYSLRAGDRVRTIVGPLTLMGVAEELVFRGYVQGEIGLIGSILAYTAVQLVVGNWALTLAALLSGAVWGTLAWWTGGLLAPVVAHVLWTSMLTFVWPLRGCGKKSGAADVVESTTDDGPGSTPDSVPGPPAAAEG